MSILDNFSFTVIGYVVLVAMLLIKQKSENTLFTHGFVFHSLFQVFQDIYIYIYMPILYIYIYIYIYICMYINVYICIIYIYNIILMWEEDDAK